MSAAAIKGSESLSKNDMEKLKQLEKDPMMSQLLSKLIESAKVTAVKESKEKKVCPCAVEVLRKNALEILEKDNEKELFVYAQGDGKEKIYTQCSRPIYEKDNEKEKFCWKHSQVNVLHPENVILFEKIKESDTSRTLGMDDQYFTATPISKTAKDTLNFICSYEIKKAFAEALGEEIPENISTENETVVKVLEDDQEIDIEEQIEEEEEVVEDEEADEDKEDEEEVDCKEITTNDGRTLYFNSESKQVYSPEGDESGKELGILTEVSELTTLQLNGVYQIVAAPIEFNSIDYLRCALSDKLYQFIDNEMKLVGKVTMQKNGEYKVHLTPDKKTISTKKEIPKKEATTVKKDSVPKKDSKKDESTKKEAIVSTTSKKPISGKK
jgi:hypothetical protein